MLPGETMLIEKESDGTEAPCGGIAVGARTDFPITGGALAFIQQDESFDVEVRVAYTSSNISLSMISNSQVPEQVISLKFYRKITNLTSDTCVSMSTSNLVSLLVPQGHSKFNTKQVLKMPLITS